MFGLVNSLNLSVTRRVRPYSRLCGVRAATA
jgi:hypothetical protein